MPTAGRGVVKLEYIFARGCIKITSGLVTVVEIQDLSVVLNMTVVVVVVVVVVCVCV